MKFYEYFVIYGFAIVISLMIILGVNEIVRALIKRRVKNDYEVYKEIFDNEKEKQNKNIK